MDITSTVSVIPIFIIGLITMVFYIRYKYFLSNEKSSQSPDNKRNWIQNRTKYPEANVFQHRPVFFKMGLIGALSFTLMAFSWTTYDNNDSIISFDEPVWEQVELEPPRTMDPPKPPPPPPQPIIEEVPEEIVEEEPKFIDMSIDVDEEIEPVIEEPKVEEVIALPPPPIEEEDVLEIFKVVEEMPRFPGCENGSKEEKKLCSDKKLLTYLAKNISYPHIAKENGIQGKLYVQFVVNTDGTIQDAKVFKDPGGGCGDAALKVVNDMNNLPSRWSPGRQRGKAVRVMFTLPVDFNLN